MTDQPEATTPAGEGQSEAPATPPAPGSGTYGDMLHLADAIKMIEEKRQVAFAANDTDRQRLLKQMRAGEFPPPSKPVQKLPRRDGGDVDWSECWWAREDIELWLGGQTSTEKWEQRWNQFSNIKSWREWPSLASYAARRVVKGEGEWEHWADRYRPRSFTGQFLRFLAWACIVGAVTFYLIPIYWGLDKQLVETDEKGKPIFLDDAYITADGQIIKVDMEEFRVHQKVVYVYANAEKRAAAAAAGEHPVPAKDANGKEMLAPKYKFRTKKDGTAVVYVNKKGETITEDEARFQGKGVPEYPMLSFLAAKLDLFPGATVPLMIFLVLVGLPALMMGYKFCYGWLSLSYVLTDSRLIVREGLLARHEHQVRVIQIQDMSVTQGLLQVMLGVGDILVHSDDVDTPELTIQGIRDPRAVKDRMFAVSETAKQEKRYYIESTGGGSKEARPAR
ncbi:MAG: PH domain-containing protein [Planctomycetota bacterium]